jgi:hypothetical protein
MMRKSKTIARDCNALLLPVGEEEAALADGRVAPERELAD